MNNNTTNNVDQFGYDVQKFYIEWLLSDVNSFKKVVHEFKEDYFDCNIRSAVREIKKYFSETNKLPTAEFLNAKTNNQNNFNVRYEDAGYMLGEYQAFARSKAFELAVYTGIKSIQEGKLAELVEAINQASQITMTGNNNKWAANESNIEDCFATEMPDYLVQDFIFQGQIINLYSESNVGKTWIALDMGLRIAHGGMDWHGKKIKKKSTDGRVIYVGAELPASARFRAAEWAAIHRVPANQLSLFSVQNTALDLLNGDQVASFIDHYSGQSIECIFIDTLACSMSSGENENSNNEMAAVVESLKKITTGLGCAAMVMHHPGKAGTSERGGSAYKAGIDTSLKVTIDDKSAGDGVEVWKIETEKQRDGERYTRYLLKRRVQSARNPDKTTVKLSGYDKHEEKTVELWDKITDILEETNDLKVYKLVSKLTGIKEPSQREKNKIRDYFVNGIFSFNRNEFTLDDKDVIHLVCSDPARRFPK